jgi:hypothetical protein
MRFEIFTAVNTKITLFWDVTQYSLVDRHQEKPAGSIFQDI